MIREAFSRSSPSSRSLPRWAERRRRSSGVSVLLCSVRIASRPASDVAAVVPGPPVLVAGSATEKAGVLSLRRCAALGPVLAVTKRVIDAHEVETDRGGGPPGSARIRQPWLTGRK